MTEALVSLIIFSIGLSVLFFMLWKTTKSVLKTTENDLNVCTKKYDELLLLFRKVEEELKIKSDNRKEADEKVKDLHKGDALDNALNGLCKHKD